MFKTKLRSKIVPLVLVLIFCLTACTAKTPTVDFEQLSFDTSLFSYLGQPAEKAAAELEESGEWEYAYLDGKPGVRPTRREPVVVDGDEYTCCVLLNSSEVWAISFSREGRTDDDAKKAAEIQKVYDLLISELGEPEALAGGHSVGKSLEEGLKCAVVGKEVLPEQYTEWWVLDEDAEMAAHPELDMLLTCRLMVEYAPEYMKISVQYALYQPSALHEIARFATK